MPLASGDLFSSVIAAILSSHVRGADGLAVDDAGTGARCSALGLADFGAQGVMNLLPNSQVAPFPKKPVHSAPIGEIVRQQTPRTPRTVEIQNRVHHFAPVNPLRCPPITRSRQQRFDDLPLS